MKSAASYYVRLDDAHPAMGARLWMRVEAVLDKHGIRPIVAVIPRNRDKGLLYDPPDSQFWSKVRLWQDKGWHIGVHGFTHELHPSSGGLLKINPFGEFVDLTESAQLERFEQALGIFAREGINTSLFVAPAHAFDQATLIAAKRAGFEIISDGFDIRPYRQAELLFVPQQLWRPRWMPFGTWTICLHPSGMKDGDIDALDRFLAKHRMAFPEELPRLQARQFRTHSRTAAAAIVGAIRLKKLIRNTVNAARALV